MDYKAEYEKLIERLKEHRTKIEIIDERGQVCEFNLVINENCEIAISECTKAVNCYCADIDEYADNEGEYNYMKVRCSYN